MPTRLQSIMQNAPLPQTSHGLISDDILTEEVGGKTWCIGVISKIRRETEIWAGKIPVPAVVKKHVSKKDAAFIAAAYAIPLPGTAFCAAIIIAAKLGIRHLRNRLKPALTINASNG